VDRRALRVRARHRVRQTILDLHLDRGATLSAVLGSDAGVELAQSATVAVALPLVVLMSRSRAYTAVRVGLAALRAAAAGARVVAVLRGGESVLQPAFDVVRAHPLAALVVLASSAAALRDRVPAPPDGRSPRREPLVRERRARGRRPARPAARTVRTEPALRSAERGRTRR
jgi:hypothetical protein